MALTNKQIAKAASLYSLALAAHATADADATMVDDGQVVLDAARRAAEDGLRWLGHSAAQVRTLEDCICVARQST